MAEGDMTSSMDMLAKKKKKSSKYNYKFGDNYPGTALHKKCFPFTGVVGYSVPYWMGWLWNSPDQAYWEKPRRGWRPGAIGKSMAKVMTFKLPRTNERPKKSSEKKKPPKKTTTSGAGGRTEAVEADQDPPLQPKAALKVNKKGDVFTIEVSPLKNLLTLKEYEEPYEDCDPLVFKIEKKRNPEELARKEAKILIKMKKERDDEIRRQLAEATDDICKCAYMDIFCNDYSAIDEKINACPAFTDPPCVCQQESISSLSSNASWDIEYTPPYGCFDTQPEKVKNYVTIETQYDPCDAGPDARSVKSKKSGASMRSRKRRK